MPIQYDIDRKRTALIVVDMQNFFCIPSADGFVEDSQNIISTLQKLITTFREASMPVIYLRRGVRGDGSDTGRMKDISPQVDERIKYGSWNVQIIPELEPQTGDIIIDKGFFGGFTGTDLDTVLRAHDINTVVISGTLTNICCDTTARQAVEKEYKVIFLSDGTAAGAKPDLGWGYVSADVHHRVTLTTLASTFCQVSPTQVVIDAIKNKMDTSITG
ncbi:cysteine hydrolase family protein [Aquibacillus albus]|uniref:Ureidoacrylate peracid hydrolase n=1 Tax=Aquibacillus albus TaxID=1168171 RepID=A0ABS2N6B7_9BACI|nr:isochorismatase family cysteine hydrolase [Aquibacillus albus]MBM7573697.1 ureidoacrylate peracid hydrolase [Aquibacillus albus]